MERLSDAGSIPARSILKAPYLRRFFLLQGFQKGGIYMWLFYACGSAFFAGVTAILAKCGIRHTDSDVATALRTIVVAGGSWMIVFLVGSGPQIFSLSSLTWMFLFLSGLATGFSWLCYFRALQLGDVNKVVPIDKCSVVLTVVFAFLLLGERISLKKLLGVAGIAAGTLLMITKKDSTENTRHVKGAAWLFYAVLSAVFASLTSVFGKIGIAGVESNLGTAIRTVVVLAMAWLVVVLKKKTGLVWNIPKTEGKFIFLSGIATGASWLCYYKALQNGPASVVVPVDKLSILVTVLFSYVVFREKLTGKGTVGLVLLVMGTIWMI